MKRLMVIAFVLALAGCATLLGPREVDIPLARLQEAVSKRFPFNNRYLELLDIRVTNPRVTLQPESNRILTAMDISVAPPFLKQSWNGNLGVSGQLRVDMSRNALVLAEPRVETVHIAGLDSLYANQITKVASLLAEQLLRDAPIYTFRPEDLQRMVGHYQPTKITARPNGLVVTFEPAR